jgi:hypothetical protein
MLIPFSKRRVPLSSAPPLDFYRFRHREEKVDVPEKKVIISRPLWVVGFSPFDPVIADDAGHVVHLGDPRFTARWTMHAETIAQISRPDYHDEDLNIVIYETLAADGHGAPTDSWFIEAACAVAYTKGLIAAIDPEEVN